MILGGGPNRIGQGLNLIIAVSMPHSRSRKTALKPSWSIQILKPCSTDYDTSDKLFFEPLTLEDVLHITSGKVVGGRLRSSAGRRR